MKKIVFLLGFLGIASAQMDHKSAYLRLGHFSPDAPNVDIYINQKQVLSNVAFKAITQYDVVPAGKHTIVVTVAGDKAKVVIDTSLDLKANTYYTVVATGLVKNIKPQVFMSDKITMKDKSIVNVFHLSPDAPAVDLLVSNAKNAKIVNNLAFPKMVSTNVTSGKYSLNIVPAGKMEPIVKTINLEVMNGNSYSAFAVGLLNGKGPQSFDVVVAKDEVSRGIFKL